MKKALATSIDWRKRGLVTPAKDQGAHGYCGTFGRVAAAEGQYARHSGHGTSMLMHGAQWGTMVWDACMRLSNTMMDCRVSVVWLHRVVGLVSRRSLSVSLTLV